MTCQTHGLVKQQRLRERGLFLIIYNYECGRY